MKNFTYYSKWALRIGIGIAMVYSLITTNWQGVVGGLIIFLTTYMIDFINRNKKVIRDDIAAMYYSFCIFAVVLGTMFKFYGLISWWDILMHVVSGIIIGAIANSLLNALLGGKKINPMIRFLFVISVAVFGGVLWEVYEFTVDHILFLDTQQVIVTGVSDTMSDLIADLIGAFFIAIYFSVFDRRGI